MDFYSLLIFLHVLGGVGVFVGLGIEVVALRRLERAVSVDQARSWVGLMREGGRIGPVAMVTILLAGVWMMALRWGPEPWILTALVALIAMAILGAALTRPGMALLGAALTQEEDELPGRFRTNEATGSLSFSLWLRVAIGVGILGLMTVKPEMLGSLGIMGATVVIGVGAALRLRGRRAPMAAVEVRR
jgi:hypothetical protein